MITRAQAEAYRNNPNVMAFLNVLSDTEGTTKYGYATGFGGNKLPSLDAHPLVAKSFKQTDGKRNTTTAAGRYQFLGSTWQEVAKGLDLKDFKPISQDLGAIALLDRAGALKPVLEGDFRTAAAKAGTTWASLPSSPYPQPKKSSQQFEAILAKHTRGLPARPVTESVPALRATQVELERIMRPSGASPGVPPLATTPMNPGPVEAVAAAFDGFTSPKVPSYAAEVAALQNAPVPTAAGAEEDAADSWQNMMLGAAVDDDANGARSDAVAKFFGEVPVPQIQIPEAIDKSINRYLAQLS